MKAIFPFLVIIISTAVCYSQDKSYSSAGERAQDVFGEIGGNGLLISVNYDTRLAPKQNGIGARAGIGYIADPFGDADGITIPLGINYLIGNKSSYLELGAGVTVYSLKGTSLFDVYVSESGVIYVPSIGYRYQPIHKGFTGRIFISPIITNGGSAFWLGLSAGYKF